MTHPTDDLPTEYDALMHEYINVCEERDNLRALLAEQARPTQVMQEARETLLIAAANFGGVAPSARDRCIRAANALHEVYTAQPLKAEQAKDAAEDAPDLTKLDELAKAHAINYASPHHFTMSVNGLREIIRAARAAERKA